MAEFTPSKKTAQDFNDGVEYIDGIDDETGDFVHAETINNLIESQLWTQALATNPVDNTEANNVGEPSITIQIAPDGTPYFKAKDLKGEDGVGIASITPNGVDNNGGNIYTITLDDERDYNIVAPKGATGDTGNGIASTIITYAASTSGTTPPAIWQSDIPTVAKGSYLWTRTVITDTNGISSTSYSSAYQGKDGLGAVTGIKGNEETTYRTGDVNLTPENIGAVNKAGDTMTGELIAPTLKGKDGVFDGVNRVYSNTNPPPTATASTAGIVKLGSATVQTVAAVTPTTTSSRTYPVQVNSAGQAVINVPWTNTVYGASTVYSATSPTSGTKSWVGATTQSIWSAFNLLSITVTGSTSLASTCVTIPITRFQAMIGTSVAKLSIKVSDTESVSLTWVSYSQFSLTATNIKYLYIDAIRT